MSMFSCPDHPDIACTLRTGYPTFGQPGPDKPEEPEPKYDENTIDAVMEAFDGVLKQYLSDNLRVAVWNAVALKFPGFGG